MLTRILEKTIKVKSNFVNGKKKFKRILSCLLVEGEKFKLRICLRGFHLCCRFCCELGRPNA